MAQRRLGKGLDGLIPASVVETPVKKETPVQEEDKNGLKTVKISMIEPNRDQPRRNFKDDSLEELAESIKLNGLLQPILVQDKKDHYEIIAGERRWRASKLAGLKEVPIIVKDLTDEEVLAVSLIENIQREDINPIEEALAYKRLMEEFHLRQDEVAEKVSKSRTAVTNSIRLLKLTAPVQQMIVDEMISTGHGRALIPIQDPELQLELAQKIFDEQMSVREVEKMIRNMSKPARKKEPVNETLDTIYKNLTESLKNTLGTKVSIDPKKNGSGKLTIEFYSHDDLDRLVERLSKE